MVINLQFDDIRGMSPSLESFGVFFGPIVISGQICVRIYMVIVVYFPVDFDGFLVQFLAVRPS